MAAVGCAVRLAGGRKPAKRKTSSCDMLPAGFADDMPTRRTQPAAARQPAGRRAPASPSRQSGPQTPRPRTAAGRARRLARVGEYASPACAMPEIED